MNITILGSGSTYGVPTAGGDWGFCNPNNPKNKRLRPSVLVEANNQNILIDIGPDFTQQTAKHKIKDLDAILITHCHADHMIGIFELPRYMDSMTKDLNIYCDAETLKGIKRCFYYLFENEENITYFGEHRMCWHTIEPFKEFFIGKQKIVAFPQEHGYMNTLGFKLDKFAYSSDLKNIPEESQRYLQNLDLWILDCDNPEPSESHNDLKQALSWVEKYNPNKTILTHLDEDMDYETISKNLPPHIEMAYDDMNVSI